MKKQYQVHCKILFLFFIGFWPKLISAQVPVLSDKAKFSILTVDVANESHTLYGHTALRVQDSISHFDVVYNYGMFDFRTENFLLKFTKGDLQYYAAVYPYADFEYSYQEENRSFYEQELLISTAEKQELFTKLNQSVFTEDRFYTYKFIDRNCTTKVIDIVNAVLSDHPIKNSLHKNESYREVLYPYQKNHYFLNLGINIIFGQRPDQQAATLFLPMDLKTVLEHTQHNGKALATKSKTIFKAVGIHQSFNFFDSIYFLALLLGIVVLVNKKAVNVFYFSMTGLMGVFFIVVSCYSLHREVLWNYNILLCNPLNLVLVYFILKNNTVWIQKTSLLLLLFLGSYAFYMLSKIHLVVVLPIIATSAIQLLRIYFKKKQLLTTVK